MAFDPSFLKRYTDSHYIDSYLVYLSGVLDHFLNPGLPIFLIFFDNRFQYFPTLSNRISEVGKATYTMEIKLFRKYNQIKQNPRLCSEGYTRNIFR